MTKIGHDEAVTINREIIANHLNVSIFHYILSSSYDGSRTNNTDRYESYNIIWVSLYAYVWFCKVSKQTT